MVLRLHVDRANPVQAMALLARKLRQDERVECSTPVELAYPVECPALVTNDQLIQAWAVLFFPALARGDFAAKSLHVTKDNGKSWPTLRRNIPALAYVKAHLKAGETNQPFHLDGEGKIHAIGARFRKDERTCILNFDLDGRTNAREFVRSMGKNGVRGLLTSSSGKSKKYRFLVFLDRWYTIGEVQSLGKALCEKLGFKVEKGAVEIFPSTVNGRFPGGYGALTVYDLTNLSEGIGLTLPAFLRTFHALPHVELAGIVDELCSSAEHDERLLPDISPSFECSTLELELPANDQKTRKQEPRKHGQTRVPTDVSRWINSGVEPGERQQAIFALTMHAWFQGKNYGETIAHLTDWIRQGGLDRSRFMHEQSNAIERQIRDLPRTVTNIFARCGTFKRSAVNAPPAHLSAADILALNADVERVVAMGKAKENNWTARRVKMFAWSILPFFKGAAVDSHVDGEGRAIVRLHWERWEAAAGGGSDYAKLRDAFGWFVTITDYLPAKWAKNPDDAHATTWAFVPPLTSDAPKRALGRTWEFAVIAAAKRERWESRKQGKAVNA